jgi:hypothetical protein
MKIRIGKAILVVGFLHSVFGFIVFLGILAELGS